MHAHRAFCFTLCNMLAQYIIVKKYNYKIQNKCPNTYFIAQWKRYFTGIRNYKYMRQRKPGKAYNSLNIITVM